MINVEGFYTFLFIISILFLLLDMTLVFLPENNGFITVKVQVTTIAWSTLFLTFVFGSLSIIYCCIQCRVNYRMIAISTQGASSGFVLKTINSLLILFMIFLQITFICRTQITKKYHYIPAIHSLCNAHILATNCCLWAKHMAKETVVYVLSHYIKENRTIRMDTFTVPPFLKPCEAYTCYTNENVADNSACESHSHSIWTIEEGFYCDEQERENKISAPTAGV